MNSLPDSLRIKIFADGADQDAMLKLARNPCIQGFTTNPSLMRQAGVRDYEAFAREIVRQIPDRPISLEVFADEFPEMERQALKIASWGRNVYVKIPVMNTRREPALGLVRRLSQTGVKVNVTAILTLAQVRDVTAALACGAPSFVSVFAGRVADTGRNPEPLMAAAVEMSHLYPGMEVIWASTRQLLDIVRADEIGCQVITVPAGVLAKISLLGKDLEEYSHETVQGFYDDATRSGYTL